MRRVLTGTIASRGMALGRARLVQPSQFVIDERPLGADEVEAEVKRLDEALAAARAELNELREKLHGALAREVGEFIDAHSMLLSDPELIAGLKDLIRKGRYRAGAALKAQRDRLVAVFESMDDPYLRSRREDIDHVIARVHGALLRQTSREERKLAARVGEILVSDNIAPAELAHLSRHGLLGMVATSGSPYSHSAILARSLRLPMLVGAHQALTEIQDDDLVLVDGEHGEAIVHPTAQDLARYRAWQRDAAREGQRLAALAGARTLTRDGHEVRLFANAELPEEIAKARALGSAGVGLYRTEFLFLMRNALPDEEEQYAAYRDLVLGMGGLPVTIRTLDLGADKADATGLALMAERNPALGVRGVRLSLRRPAVFATQLRAILRASCYGPVRVLVPMVSSADELEAVRTLAGLCARDLRGEGYEIAEHIEIGAMIEVPAAAIGVRALLAHADFVAIGTNDLAQYVLAADRNNDALGALYDPLHPALLRLIAHVIGAGRRARKPVSLCGEIAGDVRFTPLLLALGLQEFSMHTGQILAVRDRVAGLHCGELRALAPRLLRAATRGEVEAILDAINGV
ncbi:phosphoenolpyruvate--protein phosphotransferase [Mizugakiibacter sediminis]|uniref:Phosphoenolpyruvate-protein phosphotransferase n=1 Tax=Mizugakiibacter sediminis TaxID=1475481 RepID=A0A0K8QNK4_9GAMM|nr:phosphoenolpyruvate--protein phosphotransferase [Mizugakiibacter sediminis]GAP66464.1 phosphoenolpyruvate--protein phosphotransferase [Mizugakiibacter sediminis]